VAIDADENPGTPSVTYYLTAGRLWNGHVINTGTKAFTSGTKTNLRP
jgi:hypothetical protein